MLSTLSFWTGTDKEDRRLTYLEEYSPRSNELESNAADLIPRIQSVVDQFKAATNIELTIFASGWRPKAVNDPTKLSGAATKSTHLDANAGDVKDTLKGEFAWWCFKNPKVLEVAGLYMEHPAATVLMAIATPWCHSTRIAPKSGLRAFHPSQASFDFWTKYVSMGGKPEGGPVSLRK